MLAAPQRRQHLSHQPACPSSIQHVPFDTLSLQQQHQHQVTAQHFYQQKLLNDYLESQQTFANPTVPLENQSNPFLFTQTNPSIRVQQPSPAQESSMSNTPSAMNATEQSLANWMSQKNLHNSSQSLQPSAPSRLNTTHHRAPSTSSASSVTSQFPSMTSASDYAAFANMSAHLPTPTQTPIQDSFVNTNFNNAFSSTSNVADPSVMAAHMSMKQALIDQQVPEEEVPAFGHSSRHSVSSPGQSSPATPQHVGDEDVRTPLTEIRQPVIPRFERTYTDVAADYSFDPNAVVVAAKPAAPSLLSPFRHNSNDIIQRSLHAAQAARSHSPTASGSRGDSPFRRGSPYRQPSQLHAAQTMSGSQARKDKPDTSYAMKAQAQARDESEPKTISPKDALFDFREADDDAKVPLFPDTSATSFDNALNTAEPFSNVQPSLDVSSQAFLKDAWSSSQFQQPYPAVATAPPSTSFSFASPSVATGLTTLPYTATSQYRPLSHMTASSEPAPEFPAHLTSMESSASEAGPEFSSQSSDRPQKPVSTKADTGTYTCTYHGCTQRFETPQKLQKHKREGHRNTANVGVGSGMTSAALLERNSQAGPHKCERINPTTGKPCNTIFSRPYDLTRHEDTIHNVRKQKVRCALCVEEKTFSRNDALTRHMRVVHPEVDFPGKHKRRGDHHD